MQASQASQLRNRARGMPGRTPGGAVGRKRPRRRPAPPPATGPSSRRLPAGTPIPPGVRRDTPNSHIQIVPRPPDSDITYFADAENDAPVPIRTNQSYVVEAEAVVLRGAPTQTHQRQTSGHTFADMARAGVGVEAYKNELMASNEPQPLGNYLKFTKPKPGKGFDKQKSITADASPTRSSSPNQNKLDSSLGNLSVDNVSHTPPVFQTNNRETFTSFTNMDPITALHRHMEAVPVIFGQPLPGPHLLESTEGKRDGEIQFIVHPNGNIQAHQWSMRAFQWSNVGQYSYNRKMVEGVLAKEQLKGQKIGSSVPRNTLEYFIAIAKQFEETSIAKASEPTGYEPGGLQSRVRPAVPLAHPMTQQLKRPALAVDTTGEATRSFSSAGHYSQQTGLPTLAFFSGNSAAAGDPFSSPTHISSTDISPLTRRQSRSPEMKRLFGPAPRNNIALAQSGLLRYPDPQSEDERRRSFPTSLYATQLHKTTDDLHLSRKKVFQEEQQRLQKHSIGTYRPVINEDSDEDEGDANTAGSRGAKAKEDRLNGYLDNITSTVTPYVPPIYRGPDGIDIRTQSRQAQSTAIATIHNEQVFGMFEAHYEAEQARLLSLLHKDNSVSAGKQPMPAFQYPRPPAVAGTNPPTSSGSLFPDLRQSDPEIDYRNRQRRIVSAEHTVGMSNEELMEFGRPTPQYWDGPFLTDAPVDGGPSVVPNKGIDIMHSDDKTFMQFWLSGTKFEREEAHLQQLEKTQSSSAIGTLPAPIGTLPSLRKPSKSYTNSIERILLPVRETLLSYTEGKGKADYFSRFAKPPDYCINDTPAGRLSFFGEDYGKAPARVGRDVRYRPFDGISSSSSAGGGVGVGGLRGGNGLGGLGELGRFNLGW